MKDDTPDYSHYTLEDLHDVARRVNKQLYPERYALIMQELGKRQLPQTNERKTAETPAYQPLKFLPLYLRFFGGGGLVYLAVMSLGDIFFPGNSITFLVAFFLALGAGIYCASSLKREPAIPRAPLTTGGFVTLFVTATIYSCGGALFTWSVSVAVLIFLLPQTGDIVVDMGNLFWRISPLNLTTALGGLATLGVWLKEQGKFKP